MMERIAQGALSTKHSGGQKLKSDDISGFDAIEQFAQIPGHFPDRASVAGIPGQVGSVMPAPQGGFHVDIAGQQHWSEYKPTVKKGDLVEAGDVLSEGLMNPADVVRLKGIGEGRRYYAERFTKLLKDSGHDISRRNSEIIARAAVDHVDVQDFDQVGDYLPGDVVSYNSIIQSYKPRSGSKNMATGSAKDKYLEQPALHYSIGTQVTPGVQGVLRKHGVATVTTHDDPPAFTPRMTRLRAVPYEGEDWLAKLWSSNLKGNLLEDVAAGRSTSYSSPHPVPRMVEGTKLDQPIVGYK
jgi:hypothetical protein